jgi:hypothetical protein
MRCYAAHDLVTSGDLVFHNGLDVRESQKEHQSIAFSGVEIHWFSPSPKVKTIVGVYEFHHNIYVSRVIGFKIAASYRLVKFRQHSVHTLPPTAIYQLPTGSISSLSVLYLRKNMPFIVALDLVQV